MVRITGLAEGKVDDEQLHGAMASILDELRIDGTATHCLVVSRDGSYSASIPIAELRHNGRLSDEDTGLRLRVIDGQTLCWNVKDVGELRFTAGKVADSVPERPRH